MGTRGDMKRTMSPLVVLFIIIGLLGPTCENLNNLTDSAVSHHMPSPDQNDRTQLNDRALEYWPVANRTEIKIFRRGPLVISRKYWYPVLEIAIKKAPPISPAITSAATSTKSFSSSPATTTMLPTSSFPATAQITTLGPSTTKTKSTISTEPLTTSIQEHISKQKTTTRQISETTTELQTSAVPATITTSKTTILPTTNSRQQTTITHSTTSEQPLH
ncbi:salivary glue protein Sgs-3-like [Sinocyclocheilus grahami]|uniref:salivary glue protein Sgs-3-like n=1 Tax=Sinocyclocheilus grahami TaxID=75366 RepID=UPI0007AC9E49|nr:PREDICTED: salivary glue protein Sgs-3-like [Sinocyclocheilus grahami]